MTEAILEQDPPKILVAGIFSEELSAVGYGGGLYSGVILQHWYFIAFYSFYIFYSQFKKCYDKCFLIADNCHFNSDNT